MTPRKAPRPNPGRRRLLLAATGVSLAMPVWAAPARPWLAQVMPHDAASLIDARHIAIGLCAGLASLPETSARGLEVRQVNGGERPEDVVQAAQAMAAEGALGLIAPIGPPSIIALLRSGVLDRTDMLMLNPIPGAEAFRRPGHPRLLHVRASDGMQVRRIVEHAATIGVRHMAVISQGSTTAASTGAAANEAARAFPALTLHHLTVEDPARTVAAVADTGVDPQAAIAIGPPPYMAAALGALKARSPGLHAYAMSYLTAEAATAQLGTVARGIGVAQVLPGVRQTALPLIAAFHASLRRLGGALPPPNAYQLEGYVLARVLAEGLQRASRPRAAELIAGLRSAARIDLGGYVVDFSAGNEGSRHVQMGVIDSQGLMRT